jgi:hypothetical protein
MIKQKTIFRLLKIDRRRGLFHVPSELRANIRSGSAKIPYMLTHSPSCMFVTDWKNEEYLQEE